MSDSLRPHGLDSPWNSPGQSTGVDNLSLFQGIFPSQEWNWGLLHCRGFFTSWAIKEALICLMLAICFVLFCLFVLVRSFQRSLALFWHRFSFNKFYNSSSHGLDILPLAVFVSINLYHQMYPLSLIPSDNITGFCGVFFLEGGRCKPGDMWDLSPWTRDQTWVPCTGNAGS